MANIQSLFIIKAEDGTVLNAVTDYDLSVLIDGKEFPKEVTSAYIIQNSDGTFSEKKYNAKGSKFVTKVTNQVTGEFAYLKEMSGIVSDLLTNPSCGACIDERPTTPVEVQSSCEKPLFVKVCDYTSEDKELIVTTPLPICAKICGGSSNDIICDVLACVYEQWYVRERIVWDSVNLIEVSKTIEYSKDGVNWVSIKPENTTFGECPKPIEYSDCNPSICEATADDLSTLCAGNNFLITKPACCKIKVDTSIGSFHIKNGVQSYNSSDFGCLVEIYNVSIIDGSCSLNQIQIITNKFK